MYDISKYLVWTELYWTIGKSYEYTQDIIHHPRIPSGFFWAPSNFQVFETKLKPPWFLGWRICCALLCMRMYVCMYPGTLAFDLPTYLDSFASSVLFSLTARDHRIRISPAGWIRTNTINRRVYCWCLWVRTYHRKNGLMWRQQHRAYWHSVLRTTSRHYTMKMVQGGCRALTAYLVQRWCV